VLAHDQESIQVKTSVWVTVAKVLIGFTEHLKSTVNLPLNQLLKAIKFGYIRFNAAIPGVNILGSTA
jgi:hypothetical protein